MTPRNAIAFLLRLGSLALAAALLLSGCLPEDQILGLGFSPDAQKLACVSEKKGLRVLWPATGQSRTLVPGRPCSPNFCWSPNSKTLAYVSDARDSWDIWLCDLDGQTTQVTTALSKQDSPLFLPNGDLCFLSYPDGKGELWRREALTGRTRRLLAPTGGILHPVLSADARRLAFFSFEALRPQVFVYDFASGQTRQLTSESDPLALNTSQLSWSHDGQALLYTRPSATSGSLAQTRLCMRGLAGGGEESLVQEGTEDEPACFDGHTRKVFFCRDGKLVCQDPSGAGKKEFSFEDFHASQAAFSSRSGALAFVAEKQLLALASPRLARARVLTFGAEDHLALAEAYLQKGNLAKSRAIYRQLGASIRHAADPAMLEFYRCVCELRLGEPAQAARDLEKLVKSGKLPAEVPPEALWQVLGYAHLLGGENLPRARECLRLHLQLAQGPTSQSKEDDSSAANALQILESADPQLALLYARAINARLAGDLQSTLQLFERLLEQKPTLPALRSEYLHALEGFDSDAYFLHLPARPFPLTAEQRIGYLERFVELAPLASQTPSVQMELLQLHLAQSHADKARGLIQKLLEGPEESALTQTLLATFTDFLEQPEDKPWLCAAVREVFLAPEVRGALEKRFDDAQAQLLMRLVAAKSAFLEKRADLARSELDAAQEAWQRAATTPHESDAAEALRSSQLFALRGYEAKLRSMPQEASAHFSRALAALETSHSEEFEFFEQLRFEAELVEACRAQSQEAGLSRLQQVAQQIGEGVLATHLSPETLKDALGVCREVHDAAAQSSSTLERPLAACLAGVVLTRFERDEHARAAFREALACSPAQSFLRRRALFELASLDENAGDLWSAIRRYSQLQDAPQLSRYERQWTSYHLARLKMRLGWQQREARDALSVIVSQSPGTALAFRAQELLGIGEMRLQP